MRTEKLAGETVVINKKEIEAYITNCYGFSSVRGKTEILLNEKIEMIRPTYLALGIEWCLRKESKLFTRVTLHLDESLEKFCL